MKSCFKNYVIAVSGSGSASEAKAKAVRQRCLSADFKKKWEGLIQQSDADAFILAQDALDSWTTTQTIKNLDDKDRSADVLLGKGEEERCLSVTYLDEKSRLRISSVRNCPKK